MTISASTVVEQSPRTASRIIDGEAVVIVIDERKLHALNEVGTFVWSRARRRTVAEIVDEVVAEYEVDAETATRDVIAFLSELLALGAVRVVEPDAP